MMNRHTLIFVVPGYPSDQYLMDEEFKRPLEAGKKGIRHELHV